MSNEQAQDLLYQLQALESYVMEMSQRESALAGIMREAAAAIESIRGLSAQDSSDTLVPLGMGSFAKAHVSSKDKIVINIGAGTAVERDAETAINYLESRIKEMEATLNETHSRRRDATARLEQGKQQMQQMMARQQRPGKQ